MIDRDNLYKEYIEDLLKSAIVKLEFGDTLMGLIEDPDLGLCVIGRRDIPEVRKHIYRFFGVLGPISVNWAKHWKGCSKLIESALENLIESGKKDLIEGIVADSFVVCYMLAEGLIVDNKLVPTENEFAEGKVSLGGKIFKLYASGSCGVLNCGYSATFVDSNMKPID